MASISRASQKVLRAILGPWFSDETTDEKDSPSTTLSSAEAAVEPGSRHARPWSSTLRSVAPLLYSGVEYHEEAIKGCQRPRKRSSLKALSWNKNTPKSSPTKQNLPTDPSQISGERSGERLLPLSSRLQMKKSLDRLHAKIAGTLSTISKGESDNQNLRGYDADSELSDVSALRVGMGLREEFDRSRAEREKRYQEILGVQKSDTDLVSDASSTIPVQTSPLEERKMIGEKERLQQDVKTSHHASTEFRYAIEAIERPTIDVDSHGDEGSVTAIETVSLHDTGEQGADRSSLSRASQRTSTRAYSLNTSSLSLADDTYMPGLIPKLAPNTYNRTASSETIDSVYAWFSSDNSSLSLNTSPQEQLSLTNLHNATFTSLVENATNHKTASHDKGIARGRNATRGSSSLRGSSSKTSKLPVRCKVRETLSGLKNQAQCTNGVPDHSDDDLRKTSGEATNQNYPGELHPHQQMYESKKALLLEGSEALAPKLQGNVDVCRVEKEYEDGRFQRSSGLQAPTSEKDEGEDWIPPFTGCTIPVDIGSMKCASFAGDSQATKDVGPQQREDHRTCAFHILWGSGSAFRSASGSDSDSVAGNYDQTLPSSISELSSEFDEYPLD